MTTSQPHHDPIEQGHEDVSVQPRRLVLAVLGLAALIVVSLLIVAGLNRFLARGDAEEIAQAPVEPQTPARGTPLEPNQEQQKLDYLADQQELLTTYGWVDREQGIARIPIENAMRLYLQRQESDE